MLNMITLAGIHENIRKVNRLLGNNNSNVSDTTRRLREVLDDPVQLIELNKTLAALDLFNRSLGQVEFEVKAQS